MRQTCSNSYHLESLWYLALLAICLAPATAKADLFFNLPDLQQRYEQHLKDLPSQLDVSFHVESVGARKVIYSYQPDLAMVPASGVKIITSAAALEILGPSATFETKVIARGKVEDGVLEGDLIIKGQGDPYLVSERLWLLVRDIARSGVKQVTGAVKINNTYFQGDTSDLTKLGRGQPFAAELSANSLNFNSAELHVVPEKNQKRPRIEFGPLPHDYAIIDNRVRQSSGKRRNVNVRAGGKKDGKEVFILEGEIGRNAKPITLYYSVEDPAAYFGAVILAMLQKEGIKIEKGYGGLTDFEKGREIASLESLPLLDLIRLANTYSNNFMAEQIFWLIGAKRFGAPATKEKSTKAIKEFLKRIPGCGSDDIVVANGSGLSWDGRVSAYCFVQLLQKSYHEFRGFADLIGSMPVGNSTGTLKARFAGFGSWFDPWKVRAKTGTLWSKGAVTSLVGFVPSHSGELLVFSILMNHKRKGSGPITAMRQWEEKSVAFLQRLDLK